MDAVQRDLFRTYQSLLEARFAEFDRENPSVWTHFVRFTEEAIATGRTHYSARDIIHRIRWHLTIETKSDDGFKINNNHSPYYARKLIRLRPELAGFFELRRTESDDG